MKFALRLLTDVDNIKSLQTTLIAVPRNECQTGASSGFEIEYEDDREQCKLAFRFLNNALRAKNE